MLQDKYLCSIRYDFLFTSYLKYITFLKISYKNPLDFLFKIWYKYIARCSRNFRSLELFFILFGGIIKEYKNNEELIDYLISKNVIINDRKLALKNIERYSYF